MTDSPNTQPLLISPSSPKDLGHLEKYPSARPARDAGRLEIEAKNRQKDKDARWTKKHERSYFGYKNHIGVDRRHKFVRRYVVSDASVHDS
jgi:IS5 family transposase